LELQARHRIIGDVRGVGVFFALDLVSDRDTKEPLAPYGQSSPAMNEIVAACRREGLLIFANYHRIHVVPPCTITDDEARNGLARLDRALGVADKYYVGV
jgi:taurine--2-oxoglutarate transaminase